MLTCAECIGVCCVVGGAVTLTKTDKERLGAHLDLSIDEFDARYVSIENGNEILKHHYNPCPFLKAGKCSVHPARPQVCRDYFCWNRRDLSYETATAFYESGVRQGRVLVHQTPKEIAIVLMPE